MKRVLYLILTLLLFTGFNQKRNCMHLAYLRGIDATRCGCCGGFIVDVDGETFLAEKIPDREKITGYGDMKFPIPVFISFEKAEYCENRIVITCIKKYKN